MANSLSNFDQISQSVFFPNQNQIESLTEKQSNFLNLQNLLVLFQLAEKFKCQYSTNFFVPNAIIMNKELSFTQTKESTQQFQEKVKTQTQLIKRSQKNEKEKKIKKRKRKCDNDEQEYDPNQQCNSNAQNRKYSQTKNITKNYGRAIISFILRNKYLSDSIIQKYGADFQDFYKTISSFKKKIATIEGLRSLWLQQTNPYAKPTRIISMHFLRKHSLNYLFYSKVKKYGNNLKYRKKMLDAIKNPRQFSLLKEF